MSRSKGMAKLMIQGKEYELPAKFPQVVVREVFCQCCGPEYEATGPKGSVRGFVLERAFRKSYELSTEYKVMFP